MKSVQCYEYRKDSITFFCLKRFIFAELCTFDISEMFISQPQQLNYFEGGNSLLINSELI